LNRKYVQGKPDLFCAEHYGTCYRRKLRIAKAKVTSPMHIFEPWLESGHE